MQITVYLDVLGLMNFGTDFVILFLTGLILKKRIVIRRVILGALLGTTVLLPVLYLPVFFSAAMRFLACLAGSLGAAAVTYGGKGKHVLMEWLVEVCVMLCLGGAMYGIKSMTGMTGMTFFGWVLCLAAGSISAVFLIRIFRNRGQKQDPVFHLRVRCGDRYIEEPVYLDTGNMLRDPLFGKPVILLAEQSVFRLLTEEEQKLVRDYQKNGRLAYDRLVVCGSQRKICFHELPYRSVGKQGGKLLCFLAEEILVCEREKILRGQPVAIVASELFEGTAYRGLLHSECI